tara:strand:- start:1945 stop:2127 length:183 start_codon:yes stop_codon:yes gene_type:complete
MKLIMNWDNLRGSALEKPQKKQIDLKLLEYRIMFIIREEFKDYINLVQLSNNKFGKWDTI